MLSVLRFFEKYFEVIVVAMLFVGVLGHYWYRDFMLPWLEGFMIVGLFLMLLVAVLKMNIKDLREGMQDLGRISLLTLGKLILFPLGIYSLALLLPVEFHAGLVLLAAIPAASATSGLAVILNGNIRLGLAVSVTTSLLAPFTIPLILQATIGETVEIDTWAIFRFLLFLIVGPFVLAPVLKKYFKRTSDAIIDNSSGLISFTVLTFIVAAVAPYGSEIVADLKVSLIALGLVFALSVLAHLFGLLLFFKSKKENIVIALLVMAYANSGLAILLASQYFDVMTSLVTVMSEFTWAAGLIPMKWVFAKKV